MTGRFEPKGLAKTVSDAVHGALRQWSGPITSDAHEKVDRAIAFALWPVERQLAQQPRGRSPRRPAHGGYPTPTYEQVPMRRRIDSMRTAGHSGAHVSVLSRETMERAAAGRSSDEDTLPPWGMALWAR